VRQPLKGLRQGPRPCSAGKTTWVLGKNREFTRHNEDLPFKHGDFYDISIQIGLIIIEGSLEVKLPTIWTDEKQSREEAERRERLEERRVEEKE